MAIILRQRNLFDDLFDGMFTLGHKDCMRSDIKENEKEYEFMIDMPGYKKENIKVSYDDGTLTVEAKAEEKVDRHNKNNTYLHQERFVGEIQRSFYVGNDIKEDEISAKFENGVLNLVVPKAEVIEPVKKTIEIK